MPLGTARIFISARTHARLNAIAESRGVSLPRLLTEVARRESTASERASAYLAEREATETDAENPEAVAEYQLFGGYE